jgi:hypothetical protein
MILRRATRDELKFAYDLGRANQLIKERTGEDNETTSFDQVLKSVQEVRRGSW